MDENEMSERMSNLRYFINKSKTRLLHILQQLNWTEENVLKDFHASTKIKQELESTEEVELPPSCATSNSLLIGRDCLRAILDDPSCEIPKTFNDIQRNFSRDQKLKLYQHVVENTNTYELPECLEIINGMSFAEIVAEKKKERKRRKYRTSKSTYVEELRGLVDLQMQALEQYNENRARKKQSRQSENKNAEQRNSSAHKKKKRSRSISRSPKHFRHKKSKHSHRSPCRVHKSKKHKHCE